MGFNVRTPPRPTPKKKADSDPMITILDTDLDVEIVDGILDNIAFDLMTIKVDTSILEVEHTRDTIPYMERLTPASLNVLKKYDDGPSS